jgi:hypothetical protein
MTKRSKRKVGRPAMKEEDKKILLACMLKPGTIKKIKKDVEQGKAPTPNQRIAKIIEAFYELY